MYSCNLSRREIELQKIEEKFIKKIRDKKQDDDKFKHYLQDN